MLRIAREKTIPLMCVNDGLMVLANLNLDKDTYFLPGIRRKRRADGTIKADPQAGLKSILTVSDYCSSGPWSCGPG